jgi:protoporphyrinogen oxidase
VQTTTLIKKQEAAGGATMDRVMVLGAGLAGLSAAYALSEKGQPLTIVEREATPGGLCKTLDFKGYHFDLGPHVLIPRSEEVTSLLMELCGDEMEKVSGIEAVFYGDKFFDSRYNMVLDLSLATKIRAVYDLIFMKAFPRYPVISCEDAMVNQFGSCIYSKLLKVRATKFWGIDPSQIDASWALIFGKPASLLDQVKKLLASRFAKASSNANATPDTQGLMYLRNGIQTLSGALQGRISCSSQSSLMLNCDVVAVNHKNHTITSIDVNYRETNTRRAFSGEQFISTIPVNELIRKLTPPPPREVLELANRLYYRNLLVVNLIPDLSRPLPYAWAEIYSPDVTAVRITNFAELSKTMAAGGSQVPVCLEYYCFEDDELWNMREDEILKLANADLRTLGLIDRAQAFDGFVKRFSYAYPMYVAGYQEVTAQLRDYLSKFDNLESIGRNGIFRYNNMGHSIESGLRAAENIMGKEYDLWKLRIVDGTRENAAGEI